MAEPSSFAAYLEKPTFVLTPAKLAEAVLDEMPQEGLTEEQKLYARALLLNVARAATAGMAEDASLNGGTAARKYSPAYSMARVGLYESLLYDLIDKGDVEAVRRVAQPQTVTTTAHPNFTRSRALVKKSQELTRKLIELCAEGGEQTEAHLKRQAQFHIQHDGRLPEKAMHGIGSLLGEIKALITPDGEGSVPRSKRSRRDEMEETILDFIPTAMEAASEAVAIYKKRKSALGRVEIEDKKIEKLEQSPDNSTEKWIELTQEEGKTAGTYRLSGTPKEYEFTSVGQLEALAATFPRYNSWGVSDGDGKRSCHVYDAEMAIPAIKRATYAEYGRLLEEMEKHGGGREIGGFNVSIWKNDLGCMVKKFGEIEALAAIRMEALNAAHAAAAESKNSRNLNVAVAYKQATAKATAACGRYMEKLNEKVTLGAETKTIKQLLREDTAGALKKALGAALESGYAAKAALPEYAQKTAEELYMKLAAYGNFCVRLQRRENAGEYRKTFKYLFSESRPLQDWLVEKLKMPLNQIKKKLENDLDNPAFFTTAVEAFAEAVLDPQDSHHVRGSIFNPADKARNCVFKTLAGYIEKDISNGDKSITPLKEEPLLALDDLGYFNMARLYPEAFSGGFVIAEFAQPDTEVLRNGITKEIESEVKRLAKTDMLLQLAFARAMGMPADIPIIPLHEDPATMKYAASAQEELRSEPMQGYLLQYLGLTGENAAETALAKAVSYVDVDGNGNAQVKPLTAYQDMKRYGYTDEEMSKGGLDISALQKTYVLDGPPDMEACSDNSKRATIIGAELAEQSVREKALEWAKRPVEIGGQSYVIRRQKYYGQGGAIARATEVPMDSVQATWQGEHPLTFVPKTLAHKMYNNMLGRLYLTNEAARGETPPQKLVELASEKPWHAGNMLGLPGRGISPDDRALMEKTIQARIDSTRDDPRYNYWLDTYGDPTFNHSARDAARGGNGLEGGPVSNFNDERAIGVAKKEASGIFSNVVGMAALFSIPGAEDGAAAGVPHQANIHQLQEWKRTDPSFQQRLTAAALICNFVNLEEVWKRGGVAYDAQANTVTKGGNTLPLVELARAYDGKQMEHKGFATADLVMAHLTEQYLQLEKGLKALYRKDSLLDIFDEAHRDDILFAKQLYNEILEQVGKNKKEKKKTLADEAYMLLFESGGGIYPLPQLMEKTPETALAA